MRPLDPEGADAIDGEDGAATGWWEGAGADAWGVWRVLGAAAEPPRVFTKSAACSTQLLNGTYWVANVFHFSCCHSAAAFLKTQDMLVEILGAIYVENDFAQTLWPIRWCVLQRADTKTFSEQIPFIEGSFSNMLALAGSQPRSVTWQAYRISAAGG